jgi:acetylornithine deacetylase/succinyl-diaminopimelate desuccinylase-like protein
MVYEAGTSLFAIQALAAIEGTMTSTIALAATLIALVPGAATVEAEGREILDELLRVDTSHGNESVALRPVAERLIRAGIPAEIAEASPGRGNLIARIRGKGGRKPLLLVAHVDVVPVEGQPWTTAAFIPTEKDGFLQARGVNDDKTMAAAFIATALEAARGRTPLSRDLLLVLTAGEETGSPFGMAWLAKNRPELREAEFMLNEDGDLQLTSDSQRMEAVVVDVTEKVNWSFRLVVKGKGGHSSTPWTDRDPVQNLARALVKVGEHRFPARAIPSVREALGLAATRASAPLGPALRRTAEGSGTVAPDDEKLIAADPVLNALIRTTCVITMLQAAPAGNILPDTAEATMNCRLLPDEKPEAIRAELVKVIGDPELELRSLNDPQLAPVSPINGEVTVAIRKVVRELWGTASVVQSMGTGATDSRWLRPLGVKAYGIGRAPGTLEERRQGHWAHGADERRPVRWIPEYFRYVRGVVLEVAR